MKRKDIAVKVAPLVAITAIGMLGVWFDILVLIFILYPSIPLITAIYGWITKERVCALLIGAVPILTFLLTYIIWDILKYNDFPDLCSGGNLFFIYLALYAYTIGYFASRRKLFLTILLVVSWVLVVGLWAELTAMPL